MTAPRVPSLDDIADLVFVVDAFGLLIHANQPCAEFLGRSIDDLMGTAGIDLVHPDDQGLAIESLGDTVAKGPGTREPLTLRVPVAGGAVRVLEIIAVNRLDEAVGGIVVCGRDVTGRALIEIGLTEIQRRFEMAFEHSPTARTLVGFDGRILRSNRAMTGLTGYPAERLVSMPGSGVLHPDDVDAYIADDLRALRRIRAGEIEADEAQRRLRHADGHDLWVRRTMSIVREQSEGGAEYLSVEMVDVTELREETAARLRAEAQMRALLDNTSEIVTVLEPDGRWRASFGALERILGYDPEVDPEPLGGVLGVVHSDDADDAFRRFAELAGPDADPDDAATMRIRAKDGSYHWVEVRVRNLVDDPAVGGFVLLSRDVTELREAQQLLAHQAAHDPLTLLPNRNFFQELGEQALARADREGTTVAVLFLDIDRFKRVNDGFGHPVGDRLLCEIADRLRLAVRRGDVVARFGGDEFVVLCEHPAGQPEMVELANRLLGTLARPVEMDPATVQVGASIGIAIGGGGRVTIDTLLRDADVALYRAKEQGRGRAVLFGGDAPA